MCTNNEIKVIHSIVVNGLYINTSLIRFMNNDDSN